MRLRAEQLPASLSRKLAPLYLLSGDEPLLLDEALALIRAAALKADLGEREVHIVERGFDWQALAGGLGNLSLFAAGKLIELRLPTAAPGDKGSRQLVAWSKEPPAGNVLVVITPALRGRLAQAAWVKALDSAAVRVDLPAPSGRALLGWLAARLRDEGVSCNDEALEVLAARVEGNLQAAAQEVRKLGLLATAGEALDAQAMRAAVSDGTRFDVFQLADAALAAQTARAVQILAGLEREGIAATLVLWSLVREIMTLLDASSRMAAGSAAGQALRAAGVWQSRSTSYERTLRRLRPGEAAWLVRLAARADQIVKGAHPGQPWNALRELVLALCGQHRGLVAELSAR